MFKVSLYPLWACTVGRRCRLVFCIGNSFPCDFRILRIKLDTDKITFTFCGDYTHGTAAAERIKDCTANRTPRKYARFYKLFGKYRKMRSLIATGGNVPNVPLVPFKRSVLSEIPFVKARVPPVAEIILLSPSFIREHRSLRPSRRVSIGRNSIFLYSLAVIIILP